MWRTSGRTGLLCLIVMLAAGLGRVVLGQWSSDPHDHIRYYIPQSSEYLCTDGLGGMFCAMTLGDVHRLWMIHVNADGYLTLQNAENPGIILWDEPRYGGVGCCARLIPSEPPGTVIGLMVRCALDSLDENWRPIKVGLTIVKFDTVGFTDFGRVVIPSTDTNFYFAYRGYEGLWDDAGNYEGQSDGQGGVHLLFRTSIGWGLAYNHLSRQGEWAHPLPGVPVRGSYLFSDGFGGVITGTVNPDHPGEPYAQRYNALGDSVWGTGGRALPSNGNLHTLDRGRILIQPWGNERLFMVDTNAANLYEPEGRLFRPGDPPNSAIVPDHIGGFLYNLPIEMGIWSCHSYDAEARLIASTVPGNRNPNRPDGLGGGYWYQWHSGYEDSLVAGWVWRWGPDMQLAWPESLLVFAARGSSTKWMVTDEGGVIGSVKTLTGFAFYHVNPNGTLGPRAAIDRPCGPIPEHFRIVAVYPNPFNGTTQIEFTLPSTQRVSLRLYDVLGREVAVMMNEIQTAGRHEMMFDASGLPSGVYLCRLEAGGMGVARKMVLVK